VAPATRRLAAHRLVGAVVLFLVVATLMAIGGRYLLERARGWLASQPAYLLPFREIRLDPEPPGWIKSGRRGVLEQVQAEAHWPEELPILSLDLETLANDFRRGSPWVRNVERIARPDRSQLIVSLVYRRPVCIIRTANGRPIHLDEDGVVLPADDIEPRSLGASSLPLLLIPKGWTPVPLTGQTLVLENSSTVSMEAFSRDSRDVLQAATRLAGYLGQAAQQVAGEEPQGEFELSAISILPMRDGDQGLWVESKGHFIRWTPSLRRRRPGEPDDPEKWALLRRWLRTNSLNAVVYPSFLDYDSTQVVVREGVGS
jgi:hypothetical protein